MFKTRLDDHLKPFGLTAGETGGEKAEGGRFSRELRLSLSNAVDMGKAAIGAMGGGEDWLIQADLGTQEAERYYRQPEDVERFTDVSSLSDLANWGAGAAGNATSSLLQLGLGGGAGGLAVRGLAKVAGSEALKQATRRGAIAGLVGTNYPQQFGEDIQAVRAEHGGTLPEGSVPTMALTAIAQTALDTLPVMGVLGKLGLANKARSDILANTLKSPARLRQIGRDLGEVALKEGSTEVAQEAMKLGALEWIDSNKDHFGLEQMRELVDSFVAGAVGGTLMGAPVAGLNALHSDKPWFKQKEAMKAEAVKRFEETGNTEQFEADKQAIQGFVNQQLAPSPSLLADDAGNVGSIEAMQRLRAPNEWQADRDQLAKALNDGVPDYARGALTQRVKDLDAQIAALPNQARYVNARSLGIDPNAGLEDQGGGGRPIDVVGGYLRQQAKPKPISLADLGYDTNAGLYEENQYRTDVDVLGGIAQGLSPSPFKLDDLKGQRVNYQGTKGFLVQRPQGYFVLGNEGDVLVESGESGRSPDDLGVQPDFETLVYEPKQADDVLQADFENNRIKMRGKTYQYKAAHSAPDGSSLSLTLEDEKGRLVTLRNPQAIATIEAQKIEYELGRSGQRPRDTRGNLRAEATLPSVSVNATSPELPLTADITQPALQQEPKPSTSPMSLANLGYSPNAGLNTKAPTSEPMNLADYARKSEPAIRELTPTEYDASVAQLTDIYTQQGKEAGINAYQQFIQNIHPTQADALAGDLVQSINAIQDKKPANSNPAFKPKYRSKENPALTWTGRGRKPMWVDDFLMSGGNLEDILIDENPNDQPQVGQHNSATIPSYDDLLGYLPIKSILYTDWWRTERTRLGLKSAISARLDDLLPASVNKENFNRIIDRLFDEFLEKKPVGHGLNNKNSKPPIATGVDNKTPIGKNADGDLIYKDNNGIRYKIENGFRIYESVKMRPNGDKIAGYDPNFFTLDEKSNQALAEEKNASHIQTRTLPETNPAADTEDRQPLRGGDSEPVDAGMGGGYTPTNPEQPVSGRTEESSGTGEGRIRGASRDGQFKRQRASDRTGTEPSATERDNVAPTNPASEQPTATEPSSSTTKPKLTVDDSHIIEETDAIGKGGLKAKYKDNIAAIKLVFQLEQEGRKSTAADRKTLARWVGWGGLKGVFDANNKQWAAEHHELKALLNDEQYKAARASILNAHYTEPKVVQAMYQALEQLGFKGGRVLESSMGIGNFFGLIPKELRKDSQLFGVEKDEITALLAKHLYPNARVTHSGFEDYQVPAEFFDVAIGNPPFGSEPIVDSDRSPYSGFSIHNYFFAKQIDKLREGGLLINVVSHSFLDKMDTRQRAWIAERAKLVSAVRLPETAFKENANTEVVTDILILQRTKVGEGDGKDADWVHTDTVSITNPKTGEVVSAEVSRYFTQHPEQVLGEQSAAGTMYRPNSYTVTANGDWKQQLTEWASKNFSAGERIFTYTPIERSPESLDAADHAIPDGVKVGSFFVAEDGLVYQRLPDAAGAGQATTIEHDSAKAEERLRGMIELRNLLRTQMRLERSADASSQQLDDQRKALNKAYDAFVKKNGYLNSTTNKRLFSDDTEAQLLFALEADYDKGLGKDSKAVKEGGEEARPASAKKADIFKQRVLFPPEDDALSVQTPKDALLASLNRFGSINPAWMAQAAGVEEGALIKSLSDEGLIFFNPATDSFQEADAYLSGNVKDKLEDAREALKSNTALAVNVKALEAVIPKDLLPSQIPMAAGSHWIPANYYKQFFKVISGRNVTVQHAAGQWLFSADDNGNAALERSEYGTPRLSSFEIFKLAMAGKAVEIKDNIGTAREPRWVVNEEATQAAAEKLSKLKAKWESWLLESSERALDLASIYNDTFNRSITRRFDGSHLKLHGSNPAIQLRPSQKNAIWRSIQDRKVLFDHVVGAGKTFTAIGAVMEMRRLGIARKPIVVVPNHLTLQWRDDFMRLYPSANVLAATPDDFSKENRKRLFSKIATNDWDAVIIGHSSLSKIGLPEKEHKAIVEEQKNEIVKAIEELKINRGDRAIVRDMEKIKANLEAKIKKQEEKTANKDDVVAFDELGIDGFFLDEAHEFKNLFFMTGRQRIAGLGNPAGSGKAFDLFVKLRWLDQQFMGKAPIITMTGTPVSNSLAEMFTVQRYMQYDTLKKMKIHLFDNWAKMFGDDSAVYEVAPSGVGYRVSQRFAKFRGLPVLMGSLYSSFADVVTLDDLKANAIQEGKVFPIPKIKGGRPQIAIAPKSALQKEFIGEPEIQFGPKRQPLFELDNIEGTQVLAADDGKYKVVLPVEGGTVERGFDSKEKADDYVVSASLTPKVEFTKGSLLQQFANLAHLTRQTKGKINALSLTNLANKVGLDYRLINPAAEDFADSKINKSVNNLVDIYHKWGADKGTQLVFCDLSVPLSAKKALASKPARVYVRDAEGAITHKSGVLIAPEGFEGFSYFLVKTKTGFDAYDAASGFLIANNQQAKAETRDDFKEAIVKLLEREDKRDAWYERRDAAGIIEQEAIDAYKEGKNFNEEEGSNELTQADIEGASTASGFSIYDDMKAKLMAAGIPEAEIAFIHDYASPKAKAELFKAVNAGRIRFLFGSTPKMGAGTNVQERLVALHHIDAPWRPSDLEQREGRIIRQGNQLYLRDPEGFEVEIFRYATEQTYDTRRWQIIQHKADGIQQLKKYDGVTLEIDDVSGEAANAAEMKAAASGSPLILKETELRTELQRLTALRKGFNDEQAMLAQKIRMNNDYLNSRAPAMLDEIRQLLKKTATYPLNEKPAKGKLAAAIGIDGKIYEDREAAENLLARTVLGMIASAKIDAPVESHRLNYRGLDLTLKRDFGTKMGFFIGDTLITAYGDLDNFSGSGLIQRLNNFISRLDDQASGVNREIEKRTLENEALQARLAGKFELETELEAVRIEHDRVRKALMKEQIRDAIKPDDRAIVNKVLEQRVKDLKEQGYADAVERWIAEQGGSIRFSRQQAGGSSISSVTSELKSKLGAARFNLLVRAKRLVIAERAKGDIAGSYANGTVTLYPENIQSGQAWGVFLHEAGEHAGFEQMLGAEKYQQLVSSFDKLVKSQNADALRAVERVPGDTPAEHLNSERLAYLVEDFTNQQTKTGTAKLLAQRVIAAIRAWAFAKLPRSLVGGMALTPADLQALASRAAKAWADSTMRQSTKAVQFSKASASNGLWDELGTDTAQRGVDRAKDLSAKAWQWAKDHTQEFVKTGGLATLTLRQLADIGGAVVPAVQKYMSLVERMLTERNKMLDEAGQLASRWTKLDKAVRQRLAFVMHRATLERIDPSLAKIPEPEIMIRVNDLEWREKLGLARPKSLLVEIEPELLTINDKTLKLLRARYIEARNIAVRSKGKRERFEQLQQVAESLLTDWQAAKASIRRYEQSLPLYDKLHQQFMALPKEAQQIFLDSRDLYEARFARKHQALVDTINSSDMPEERKKALSRTLQQEFESAKMQGVYFPLHRQGAYFVRADVRKEQVSGTIYFKKTSGYERINRGTGEVTQESNRWDSKEAALRSANSRTDLVGKDLIAVEQGDGWVLTENPTEPVFLMFPTAAEAERETQRLEQDASYSNVRMGKLNKNNTQDELARASVLMQTMTAIRDSEQDVPDEMYQLMLEMLPELSMRKNSIHRKGVLGFSGDALQAFGHQMMHQAHQIAKLEARDPLANTLKDIEQQAQLVPNAQRMLAGNVRDEVKKRHDWVMSPNNAAWTNWTSSFGFLMYLGVSPAAALVNLSQVAIVGYPTLAAKFGWKEAGLALSQTAKQLNMREVFAGDDAIHRAALSNDERLAMDAWHDAGVIDKSQAQMLAGVADNDALSNSPTYQKWMGRVAHLFHKAEVVNREVMLLAAYRLAKAKGESHEDAIQYASDVTWESQFDYSNANRARFMQNDFAKVALMFKSYSQHMIYFLLQNARQWGQGDKEAKAKLLGILGVTLAMGGVSALPLGLVGAATGFAYTQAKLGTKAAALGTVGAMAGLIVLSAAVLGDDEDWETELRKALRSLGGEPLETLVFRGAVNLATGVDLSSRISLDDLILRDSDRDLEGADAKGALLEQLAGPVVGYGVNALYTVPELWSQDQEWRAVEKLAPKFARDLMQTLRFSSEGALTLKGSPIVERDFLGLPYSDELNVWNLFWKANGFGAEKLTRQYAANNEFMNYKLRVQASREKALNRLFVATVEGDAQAIKAAKAAIVEWNQDHPKAKPINEQSMKRSLAARLRARQENDKGVRVQAAEAYLRE